MSASAFSPASIYRALACDELDDTIRRLERMVGALSSAGPTGRTRASYLEALHQARAERERRTV